MTAAGLRHPSLVLRPLAADDEDEWRRAHRATTPTTPSFLHYYDAGMPFDAYLRRLDAQRRGIGLPSPGHVPSTFLFAFDGGRIVGRASIRHRLNESLLRTGGHVGYVVVPEFRNRGYATAILALAVAHARDALGIDRILVTCDDDNPASIKVIARNGGVLEDVAENPETGVPKRRYWIG